MTERITNLFFRDEMIARNEAALGMHHALYLFIVMKRLLNQIGIELYGHGSDAIYTGSHWSIFKDPVTQIEYELRLTPLNKVAPFNLGEKNGQ